MPATLYDNVGGVTTVQTPEPVREKAGKAVEATRDKRGPVLAGSAALVALCLISRSRRRR